MPKSKRAKVITLSKTLPKGRSGKMKLVEKLQGFVEEYKTVYIFEIENMRTKLFQELRSQHREESRFYMGKKSLVRLAFGKNKEESYMPNLFHIVQEYDNLNANEVGLLFTNEKATDIEKDIKTVKEAEFARGGFVAKTDITKAKGLLEGFPTSMFEHLRRLQMPVSINKGTIELLEDFEVCKINEQLTPERAEILKLLGIKLAEFKLTLKFKFEKGKLKSLETKKKKKKTKK